VSIRQSTVFGSNHTSVTTGSPVAAILAVGAAAGLVAFAAVLAAIIGGAVAIAIIVLSSTAAGCLLITVGTHRVLEVLQWQRTGQLPQPRPLVTINRPLPIEPPAPHVPRMTVTRADYDRL